MSPGVQGRGKDEETQEQSRCPLAGQDFWMQLGDSSTEETPKSAGVFEARKDLGRGPWASGVRMHHRPASMTGKGGTRERLRHRPAGRSAWPGNHCGRAAGP